jgi:hypothetical protein
MLRVFFLVNMLLFPLLIVAGEAPEKNAELIAAEILENIDNVELQKEVIGILANTMGHDESKWQLPALVIIVTMIIVLYLVSLLTKKETEHQNEKEHLCKMQAAAEQVKNEAREKAGQLVEDAERKAIFIEEQARISAKEQKIHMQTEFELERKRLTNWHYTLQSANDKLNSMKTIFQSAEKKSAKTLNILRKQSPQFNRHARYLQNKIKEMSQAYRKARAAFAELDVNQH